jgi:hypothetical protein
MGDVAGEKTMTEISHLYHKKARKSHTLDKLVEQHQPSLRNYAPFWQAGGYPHESCSFSHEAHQLEDKKLERKAYVRIAEELDTFGVSPYYVGTIWRKHKQDILDTVNRDLGKSLKTHYVNDIDRIVDVTNGIAAAADSEALSPIRNLGE